MSEEKYCPVCGSKNIVLKTVRGIIYLCCKDCEFDEETDYDAAYPEGRSSQKGGKRGYTPYRRGGGQRTRK